MTSSNLGSLFAPDPSVPAAMSLRQGVIQSWDPETGENTIQIAGGTLVNVPTLISESVNLVADDVVALLTTGDRWLLVGKVTTPGDPGTVPTWTADITALDEDVTTINTVTIPGVQADVFTAQTTADTAQSTATSAAADAATADSNATAALAQAIDAAADALAAAGDAATALAKFPIVETDISDQAISTPKLAAGAIDGLVITGALIRSAASGRRVELTAAGFVVYAADGSPLILFPTDPDLDPSFAGNVQAKQFTAEEGATLRGDSELSPGSSLQLRSGVSAPKSAPVVTIDWPSIPWFNSYGLHWDGTNWVTITDTAVPTINTINSVGGTAVSPIVLSGFASNFLRPWGGLTKIGSSYYTLSYVNDGSAVYRINKLDSSGATTLSATYTPIAGPNGSGGSVALGIAPASIGTNGTDILIAEYDSANAKYRIQLRSTTTLSVTSTINTNFSGGGPVVGIAQGNFDFGSARYLIATRNNGIKSYNSSGTLQSGEAIPAAAADVTGVSWNGSNIHTTARNGGNPRVFKHTAQIYANSVQMYATYTWYETGGADETTMGPVAVFTPPSRSRVTLTSVAIPGQADSVRFYIGTSATRTDQWRQVTPSAGVITKSYETILSTGNNPPSANGFPNTAPAAEVLYDDGSVAVSADGTMNSSGAPVVNTTGAQTLTNKDLSAATNAFPFSMATGNFLFTAPGSPGKTQAISFPAGRFTAAPFVVATPRTSAVTATMQVGVSGETSTGFNLHFMRADNTTTNVGWIAIQV